MRKFPVAMLAASALLSLPTHAADLLQVYKEALANDPVYASARATLASGQEKGPQGRAGLLPTVGLSGGYSQSNFDVQNAPPVASRGYFTNGYTVALSQPLFRWANWEQYEQGKLSVAISEAQFAQAQQDLIVRVGQAYFDVLTAQDALASLQAQQTAITEQLASAKRNFEVGTATITDTHEAQARFDLASAQALAAENDLQIKRTALQQIIGKPPAALAPLRAGVQLNGPVPEKIDQWVDGAERQNYSVVAQQLSLEIAQRDIKKNRAGHAPTLDLVASRNHTTQSGSALTPLASTSNATTVGIQWNMPLFAGFGVTSKVRESIALEDKARNDLESARRTAAQGARQSYLGVNSGLAQVKALEAAEASSKLALESNKLGYQVGVRINIDVLNAQQQLYATQKDLAKARYDTVMNGLRLKSTAGSLKEDDLVQVNGLLNPDALNTVVSTAPVVEIASPAPSAAPVAPVPDPIAERADLLATVNAWADAWSRQDVQTYLAFYSGDFQTPGASSRKAWEEERSARILGKTKISVTIESPQVVVSGNSATVTFRQIYVSDKLRTDGQKSLVLEKQNDKWLIKQERSAN